MGRVPAPLRLPQYPGGEIVKIQAVRAIAKEKGVIPRKMSKREIVRAIQEMEGNFPCFGTARDGYCDREDCAWREDCLPPM